MPLHRQREILPRHAAAVIPHLDETAPAVAEDGFHLSRPGIERIFHQLLDHGRRPLHHLTGGDAVDEGFGQTTDGHGRFP